MMDNVCVCQRVLSLGNNGAIPVLKLTTDVIFSCYVHLAECSGFGRLSIKQVCHTQFTSGVENLEQCTAL